MSEKKLEEEIEERTRAIRQSERTGETLFENANDLIFTVDKSGLLRTFNPEAERLSGYQAEEVEGRSLEELVSRASRKKAKDLFNRTILEGIAVFGQEVKLKCKDGSELIIEINTSPLYDENGQITGGLGTARNITERKQAERRLRERNRRLSARKKMTKNLDLGLIQAYAEVRISQDTLRDLLDSASNAVLFLKLDGTITGVNTKAKELFGYSRDEFSKMNLYQLIPQSFSERTEEMFKKLRIGFSDSFETEILTNDKEILKLELNASVIEQEKGKVALIFFRQKRKVIDYGYRYCPNPDCPDYRKYGQGNIVFNDWIGKDKSIARLRCNTCRMKFSSNKGTVFEQSRSSQEKGICIYKCLVHGNSIEATADICEVNPKTVSRLVEIAGEHDLEHFTAYWSRD